MLKVEKEQDGELPAWLAVIQEHCVFCDAPTRHWHMTSNTPVCEHCAKVHDERDLAGAIAGDFQKPE